MNKKSFVYYGYDRDTYMGCLDLIRSTNRRHVEILTVWFALINVVFLFCSIFGWAGLNKTRIVFCTVSVITGVVFEILILLFRQAAERFYLLLIYLSTGLLAAYGIMSSNKEAFVPASIFLVIIILVAVSYIDNMFRMSLVLIIAAAALILESRKLKPASIASQDMFNALIILALALALHYFFQRARMSQFETFQKNVRIQRELEVKSSFDALTGLLNRGRFFQMAGQVLRTPHEEEHIALALMDLDGFKQINDTFGHQMGDKVIQIAAETILTNLGIDYSEKWSFPTRAIQDNLSFAGRLGGDEYIVLIRGRSMDEVQMLTEKLLRDLNSRHFDGIEGIRSSIGVTEIKGGDLDIDKAYNRVDDGLYQSKREGKNRISFIDNRQGA